MEQIISAHRRMFIDLAISPDDKNVLVVQRGNDVPHEEYSEGRESRSIGLIDLSEGKVRELVTADEDGHRPCWSPNGRQIAFIAHDLEGLPQIWIMSFETGTRRQLTFFGVQKHNPLNNSSIVWSPDGKQIAYSTVPFGSEYVLGLEQTYKRWPSAQKHSNVITVVPPNLIEKLGNNWPESIGFESEINIINIDTGEERVLATFPTLSVKVLKWFDHGKRILVVTKEGLSVIDVDTSHCDIVTPSISNFIIREVPEGILICSIQQEKIEAGRIISNIYEKMMERAKYDSRLTIELLVE